MWCGAPSFGADSLVSHLLMFVNIPHCWPPASRISSNGSAQSFFWCALTELGELAYYAACRSGTIIVWFLQVTYLFPWRLLFVAHLPLVVLKPVILVLLGWPSQISSVDFQYFNDGMHRKSHVPHSSSLSIVFPLGLTTSELRWCYDGTAGKCTLSQMVKMNNLLRLVHSPCAVYSSPPALTAWPDDTWHQQRLTRITWTKKYRWVLTCKQRDLQEFIVLIMKCAVFMHASVSDGQFSWLNVKMTFIWLLLLLLLLLLVIVMASANHRYDDCDGIDRKYSSS